MYLYGRVGQSSKTMKVLGRGIDLLIGIIEFTKAIPFPRPLRCE